MLRTAIAGCGGIAQVHGQILSEHSDVALTACCDIRPERADAFQKKFERDHSALPCKTYTDFQSMLESEDLDLLHICTPHYLHVPMAVAALKRGIHVFMEKPAAISREQFQELEKAEKQSSAKLGFCFQNRYNESVQKMRELLNACTYGPVKGARAFVTWKRAAPYYTESGWRGKLETEGGGALINQSIHTLDLLTYFLGKPLTAEASIQNHHLKGVIEVEDMMEAYLTFSGSSDATAQPGIPALFYATTAHCTDAPILLEITCEKAAIRMEGNTLTLHTANSSAEISTQTGASEKNLGKSYWGNGHKSCISDFIRHIQENTPFLNDLPHITDTMLLMFQLYDSARSR